MGKKREQIILAMLPWRKQEEVYAQAHRASSFLLACHFKRDREMHLKVETAAKGARDWDKNFRAAKNWSLKQNEREKGPWLKLLQTCIE